ncbi:MAG TPA: phospholipase D-like domain-containing protein, partial [Humisphaera sp.]|nr:phospholipase D-like domain-containing protein [Humisphaera sp.]
MAFLITAYVAIALMFFLLFLVLFEPGLTYKTLPAGCDLTSSRFLYLLGAVADAQVFGNSAMNVLVGGEQFYPAELAAIAGAKHSIHVERFIFHPSEIGDRYLDALCERAKAGVRVRVVVDWVGSFPTPDRYFDRLREAGAQVAWYQPFRWYTFRRFNNRTHRELLVVDGIIGFIGGAGVANHWAIGDGNGQRPWVDMMCRVQGDLVLGLQACFAENWIESTGEILDLVNEFPDCGLHGTAGDSSPACPIYGSTRGIVIISTPSAARSTRARILYQVLLASAKKTIFINSPYFLPDRSARAELIRAVERGVRVVVLVPGTSNNHYITRLASRRHYGELLRGGVEIYEYQPGMIHKKSLVVDGAWSVVGSTNFDTRSFGINDEVNLAALDKELATRLEEDFAAELAQSRRISLELWEQRTVG